MAIGAYATLAAAKQRIYEAGTTVPTDFDAFIQSLCDDVNSWIENSRCQRILAPVPPFASQVSGAVASGAASFPLLSVTDLNVGDDVCIGLLSGTHESTNVIAVAGSSFAPYTTWAPSTFYGPSNRVIPTVPNGHVYENGATGGTGGSTEPTWPTNGGTVSGGTGVTWDDLGIETFDITVNPPLQYGYADATYVQTIIVQDGFSALDGGYTLPYDRGIITLAAVETAPYTGGPWAPISQTGWFLRPTPVDPGWPYTAVLLTNIPVGSQFPVFYPGYANIRLIGPGPIVGMPLLPFQGFPYIQPAVQDVALKLVVAGFRTRASSGADTQTINIDGSRTYESALSYTDRQTLERYRIKSIGVVGGEWW